MQGVCWEGDGECDVCVGRVVVSAECVVESAGYGGRVVESAGCVYRENGGE